MNKLITAMLLAACTVPALAASPGAKPAAGVDTGRLFFGAGVSDNDVSGSDSGTGYQFFGGYEFGQVAQNVAVDLEVGYMDTGSMDVRVGPITVDARAKGLWATGVGRLQLNPQFELLARAGLDFGDDDGLMVGVGAGFNVNKQTQLRLELVERDDVSSLQFNFVYRP